MITIELDFAADTLAEAIEALAALAEAVPSLTWAIAEAEGPGGWPVVAFTMPDDAADRFMALYEG